MMLSEVNRKWRELSRQTGNEANLSRLGELRGQRLALITEIFELDQKSRRAGKMKRHLRHLVESFC